MENVKMNIIIKKADAVKKAVKDYKSLIAERTVNV